MPIRRTLAFASKLFLPLFAALAASVAPAQTVNLAVSFKENTAWSSVSPADQEVTQRTGASTYSPALATLTAALPASVDLDALDYVSPTEIYFSLREDTRINSVLYADEDVIRWNGSTFAMAFDGSLNGIPASANLDAVDVLGTSPFQISFSLNVDARFTVGGTPNTLVADEDVLRFNQSLGYTQLDFIGAARGIPANADLDSFNRLTGTTWVMSFDIPVRIGANLYDDADLLQFNFLSSSFAASPYFNAANAGLPSSVDLDAGVVDTTGLNTPTPSPTPGPSQTPSATPTQSLTPTVSPSPFPPNWCVHPLSQSVNVGQNVAFYALAEGTGPLTYQWMRNGSPINGQTGNVMTFSPVGASDGGTIRCDATNPGGTTPSNNANFVVFNPRVANGASFLSHTVPATMYTGQKLNIGVAYSNTSQLSWSSTQGYSVAVRTDVAGLFSPATRLYLPDQYQVVVPGSFAVFVGTITAPAIPGVYSAQVQMIEEGVEFFGNQVSINVTVLPPPNAVSDWANYE